MKTPNRLDAVLRKMEDQLFHLRVFTDGMPIQKMLPRTSEMRSTLSRGNVDEIASLDKRFQLAAEASRNHTDLFVTDRVRYLCHHFSNLAAWITQSQRVYAPSENLADLLCMTRLPDFNPKEIKFVANTFAIQLEQPITVYGETDGEMEHDFLFCSYDAEDERLTVTSYSSEHELYQPFTQKEKNKFSTRNLIHRNLALGKMGKRLGYGNQNVKNTTFSYFIKPENGQTYEQAVQSFDDENVTFMFKMAISLNLYLQSNRKKDSEREVHPVRSRNDGPDSITEKMTIFELETSRIIPTRPSDADGESDTSLPYHFREAYWRRPPGYGQIDEAEKTVWVSSAWVREDLKDENPNVGTLRYVG